MKRDKKTGRERKKAYAMIFKELCTSQMQNIIKDQLEYDTILFNPLKLMDEIDQSMQERIRTKYKYLSLTESLARIMNTRQQERESVIGGVHGEV